MNWDFFFRQLSAGKNIDETCFSFCDDPDEKEHYLGFIPHCDEPYWIGYCDVEGGCAFKTAEELVSAPVFEGKCLRERWSGVMINGIGGLSFEEWLKYAEHVPPESTL